MVFGLSSFRSASRLPTALLAIISALGCAPTAVRAADLDSVLAGQTNLTTFRELVKDHPNIFTNLSGITIAAPNDNAFDKLGNFDEWRQNKTHVEAVLKYHVMPQVVAMPSIIKGDSIWAPTLLTDPSFSPIKGGQRLILTKQPGGEVVFTSGFANRGTVIVEDIEWDKGLVQVIDSVMRIPENLESTARNAYHDMTAFLGALFATDLYKELILSQKDITIFAPTNAAFQTLAGTLSTLPKEELKSILRYHIVPGQVSQIWELKNASSLATAVGNHSIHILRHTNFIFANSAQVLQTDILIANGAVHLIDNVLNPKSNLTTPDVEAVSQKPVFTVEGTGTATATGTAAPTPWTEFLPCTVSCPVTEGVSTRTEGTAGATRSVVQGGGGSYFYEWGGGRGEVYGGCWGGDGDGVGGWGLGWVVGVDQGGWGKRCIDTPGFVFWFILWVS
ncbi:FAS1 domain-containing protein [Apiosordaria backusii]|uniref:FAS1 domain-containing protein n=1 Tax=Apiosordaria backusii TaxID=314023 RepID=A0AA40ASK4_9PEZI|nr:FAS1 domain-containing protein [Apiosordaria backusii]